jgi:3-oxoacyl-[acyl-carrier protein] reductase
MATLITGTSRGIGKALVESYRNAGKVALGMTRSDTLYIEERNGVFEIGFDWKDYHGLGLLLREWCGGVHLIKSVIHNAGILEKAMVSDVGYDSFERQMRVNVWQVLELFRTLHGAGLMHPDAHTVAISSMGGVQGTRKFPGLAAYSMSKASLGVLMECLDAEYGGQGLTFNALALGAVNTEMLREAFPGYISQVDPENMAEFVRSFVEGGGQFMSGRIIEVAKSDPEA